MTKRKTIPTIKAVAALAGVSLTTASHALNNKGRVNPETREQVLAAASKLGYAPNPQARALKTGKTGSVLAVLPESDSGQSGLHSAFIRDILVGAADRANSNGFLLTVAGRSMFEEQANRLSQLVDGFLIVDPGRNKRMLKEVRETGKPVVCIGRPEASAFNFRTVDNDYRVAMQLVLKHLKECGYRQFALIAPRSRASYATDSAASFQKAVDEMDTCSGNITYLDKYPRAGVGREAVMQLMTESHQTADAIIAATEPLAVGASQAISELGLKMPCQIGLVSMTDSLRLASSDVPVTALDLNPHLVGASGIDVLLDEIASDKDPDEDQSDMPGFVPVRLIVRASTLRSGSPS